MTTGQILQALTSYEDFKMERIESSVHVTAGGTTFVWGGWLHADEGLFEALVFLRAHEIVKQKETV